MSDNRSFREANRRYWNEITPVHQAAEDFYELRAFREGGSTLTTLEVEEVGPVQGKSLLHLQCHFGMDTLSWARCGARVIGVDISDTSIESARRLARELGLPSRFIRCDLYDLPDHLDETFDIVYTGRGALLWLDNLERWAELVARYLKPGGLLYLMESHPLLNLFEEWHDGVLQVDASYFHEPDPQRWEGGSDPDYADPDYVPKEASYAWNWPIGDLLNALVSAGLQLESFREFDRLFFRAFPGMIREEEGWWRVPGYERKLPLTFTLRARKPAR